MQVSWHRKASASDKVVLIQGFKATEEEASDKAVLIAFQNTSSGAAGGGFCGH